MTKLVKTKVAVAEVAVTVRAGMTKAAIKAEVQRALDSVRLPDWSKARVRKVDYD